MAESSWRLFGALLKPRRREVAVYGCFLAAATALPLAAAIVLSRFVDAAVRRAPVRELAIKAGTYAGIGLVASFITVLVVWRATALAWHITDGLRHQLADQVLSSDLSFHREHTRGDLVSRADDDVSAMATFLSQFVARGIGVVLLAVSATVTLAVIRPLLAGPYLVCMIFVLTLLYRQRDSALNEALEERAAKGDVSGLVEERIAGADDIQTLGAGAHSVARLAERSERVIQAVGRRAAIQMRVVGTVKVALVLSEVVMMIWGALLVTRGSLTIGSVVLGVRFVTAVRDPIQQVVWRIQEVQGATGSATRVLALMAERRTYPDREKQLPDGGLDLRFENVSLTYDDGDSAVLQHIDVEVRSGRSLGLVGRSGSGKTSIGRLALRLLEPTEGRVLLGGVDLRTVTESDFRIRVTSIPQDVQLFPGTVAQNVSMFTDVSNETIIRALTDVGLGSWLSEQDEGLDAQLLARRGGSGLSAGEAQLLALARGLVRNPSVVVLDEATSRIDPITQERVTAATQRLLKGRTSIVIAHRLETLSVCDDIAVLEHGRVVEFGSRLDLENNNTSRFARLLASSRAQHVDSADEILETVEPSLDQVNRDHEILAIVGPSPIQGNLEQENRAIGDVIDNVIDEVRS